MKTVQTKKPPVKDGWFQYEKSEILNVVSALPPVA